MLKATLKSVLARSARWAGVLRARERRQDGVLTVLCLHRVLPAADRAAYFDPALVVTPEALDTLCSTLSGRAKVLPLAEAVAQVRAGAGHGPRVVALTFDDGYRDNLLHAAPVLARHDLRATFYVVADLVGQAQPPWYDRMGRAVQLLQAAGQFVDRDARPIAAPGASANEVVLAAKLLNPSLRRARLAELEGRLPEVPRFAEPDQIMSAEDLRQLAAAGHEIGSHSCSHEILPQLADAELAPEILASKAQLEEKSGQAVRSFCFPNGDFDARCLELVRNAGYEASVTTVEGRNLPMADPFTLRRIFVNQDAWSGPGGQLSADWVRMVVQGVAGRGELA